jgi:hypothetical protein
MAISQPWQNYLLPGGVSIQGVVIDESGKPLAGVYVEHLHALPNAKKYRPEVFTDLNGTFELETDAPALVLRKPGFEPVFVRVREKAQLRLTLRAESKRFPECSGREKCSYLGSFGSFCVPTLKEMTRPSTGQDIDYQIREFRVRGKPKASMVQGAGPMWSFGTPIDRNVWSSEEYLETDYLKGKLRIIDARGRTYEGKQWRLLGTFGETLAYGDIDAEEAAILDRLIDGACVRP